MNNHAGQQISAIDIDCRKENAKAGRGNSLQQCGDRISTLNDVCQMYQTEDNTADEAAFQDLFFLIAVS